jgi:hypothetical protein
LSKSGLGFRLQLDLDEAADGFGARQFTASLMEVSVEMFWLASVRPTRSPTTALVAIAEIYEAFAAIGTRRLFLSRRVFCQGASTAWIFRVKTLRESATQRVCGTKRKML